MPRAKREGVTPYMLRDVPTVVLERAKARARRQKVSLRDVLIAGLRAFNRGELEAERLEDLRLK